MRVLGLGVHWVGLLCALALTGCGATARPRPLERSVGAPAPVESAPALADAPLSGVAAAASCCAPRGEAGCDDVGVQACVCAEDPGCCEGEWDGLCVLEVDALGCGACGGSASCCDPHGVGGCVDDEVSACVCAGDPYCCEGEWDELCVDAVDRLGCGRCGPVDDDAPCCLPHGAAGCVDPAITACVCDAQPYCCEELWDEGCVAAVDTLGCGACEPAADAAGPCCDAHDGPGCDAPAIEACVCEASPACCAGSWGEACVELIEILGCGACEPPPPAPCCVAHDAGGCEEAVVESCVCAQLPGCCEGAWTTECAAAVESLGCGLCDEPRACCLAHETGGCETDAIAACVCDEDPYCCSQTWDDACVLEVEAFGCGVCEDDAPVPTCAGFEGMDGCAV